jgi:hypothetical protein
MRLALMQPYFLPYLGYFQLMSAVEEFVIYDDVQFIKNGWINRNRILVNGQPSYITLPVERGHLGDFVNQRGFVGYADARARILGQVDAAYRRAPFFKEVRTLLKSLLELEEENVAATVGRQLAELANYLGISANFRISSSLGKYDGELAGQDRVIEVCRTLGATTYYNAIGGMELYDPSAFAKAGLELVFIRSRAGDYKQYADPFVPNLSILDVLMFNSLERVREMLEEWDPLYQQANHDLSNPIEPTL